MCSAEIPYSFASSRYAGHPNDGGAWLRLGRGPPTPYKHVQSGNLGSFTAVQWQGWQGEPHFLNASRSALRGQRAAMLILESDCTFVFAVLLSLAVGFEGFKRLVSTQSSCSSS